tara:strand:- start:855 stop:1016 length:162 start_codon:yes stop_codon:yes gene_type:complete
VTLKEKLIRQAKLDYVKSEIANYQQAVKVGSNPTFTDYNLSQVLKLKEQLETI